MFRTEQSLKKEFLLIRVTTADKIGYKEQGILCLMTIVNNSQLVDAAAILEVLGTWLLRISN